MESYVPMAFGAEAPKTPVKGNSQTCTRLHARRAPLSASSPEEAWEEIGNRKRQAGSEQGLPIKNKKIIKKKYRYRSTSAKHTLNLHLPSF